MSQRAVKAIVTEAVGELPKPASPFLSGFHDCIFQPPLQLSGCVAGLGYGKPNDIELYQLPSLAFQTLHLRFSGGLLPLQLVRMEMTCRTTLGVGDAEQQDRKSLGPQIVIGKGISQLGTILLNCDIVRNKLPFC
jgi:hypothetical protein